MEFSKIENQIKPFDVIVFKSNSVYSDLISIVEKLFIGDGNWTHLGVVLDSNILKFKNSKPNTLYLLESTMSNNEYPEAESRLGEIGVQIRELKSVVSEYLKDKSRIGWCKLLQNPVDRFDIETDEIYNDRMAQLNKVVQNFYDSKKNKMYDFNPLALFKSILSCIPNPCSQNEMYFCSELVTKLYQDCDILDDTIDPETITPIELIEDPYNLFTLPPIKIISL